MLTKIASETLLMFVGIDRDLFPTVAWLLFMPAMNHSHSFSFSFQTFQHWWYRMFLCVVIQLFFVAKPWALVPLKVILARFWCSNRTKTKTENSVLVLVRFEHLRRYCMTPDLKVSSQ